jgi:hypothetical protein
MWGLSVGTLVGRLLRGVTEECVALGVAELLLGVLDRVSVLDEGVFNSEFVAEFLLGVLERALEAEVPLQ